MNRVAVRYVHRDINPRNILAVPAPSQNVRTTRQSFKALLSEMLLAVEKLLALV